MRAPRFHPMAALQESPPDATHLPNPPRRRRVCCFSFAAYAKAVVDQLCAAGVPLADGLSDAEFAAIESALGFEFPSDLRAILREGLPLGAAFPDWRSSSPEQLRALLRLPAEGILHEVSRGRFWCAAAWGPKPAGAAEAVGVAKGVMDAAPPLVPIHGHFYMPSRPNLAGNPVFCVRGGEVRCSGFDLTDFFLRAEFKGGGGPPAPAPAWAATSARRIDVWTHLVEGGGGDSARRPLQELLKGAEGKLRNGGWTEEEVREMLRGAGPGEKEVLLDRHSVAWHVRLLAVALLRAGWSREDVAYSMGETGVSARCVGGELLEAETWHADGSSDKHDACVEF